MSRGHGRVQRIVLESVNSTRYGCTVRQLAYLTYGTGRNDAPTEAQIVSVQRAVRRLLAEERVVERVMFGDARYILPAAPRAPRPKRRRTAKGIDLMQRQALECRECDLRWVSEEGAPHRLCWSCGEPGKPTARRSRGAPVTAQ
jgi:hypothetical protein